MRIKMAVFSAALMLLSASVAAAQSPGGPGGPGGGGFGQRRMQRLLQGITLTAEQQTKVDSITARYGAQMPAFTPGTPPDSATPQKMRELAGNEDEEIRAVLTADQQKVFDANVAAMRSRMQNQRGPGDR
jgi:Spy/CpxP family protein refolding chaperone